MVDSRPSDTPEGPSTGSSPSPSPSPSQGPAYTWQNFFKILSAQLPSAEQARYRHERDVINEEKDCKRCDEWKEYLFKYSPTIRFMRDNINRFDNDIHPGNVRCLRCPPGGQASGGFAPAYGIRICANELRNRGHLEDTLAHEMVHAYDHLRWKVDWGGKDLRHAACAEIRASSLSGECRWAREFFTRGQWSFTEHHQECVRRRAVASLVHRPWCRDEAMAKKAVNEVWESCFADTRPFDEIYR